ncbi:MAG: hypothetical protein JJU00_19720 [Opitutales bacterium]|nr:hypothetical protein [Opitutales bacterium]
MPDFENIEAYETRERSGKTRISPVAPHSLRAVDFVLRRGEARRRRMEIPVLEPPAATIDPIDCRDLEREFRAADRAERAESRRRHGGPLTRAWKRVRRYFRTLFSSGGTAKTARPKGRGGKSPRADDGPPRGRKDRRTRGGKGGQGRTGGGPGGKGDSPRTDGPRTDGGKRPRRPRGRRKGGPDGQGGGGGQGPAQASAPRSGGPGEGSGGDGQAQKKRRRNRRNRGGGGGGNTGGQGSSSSNSGN